MSIIRKVGAGALTWATCLMLLGSGASPAVAHDDGVMTQQQAGDYYLSVACAASAAGAVFVQRTWRGRDSTSMAGARRHLPDLRRASRTYSRALDLAAQSLFNPPAPWPPSAAGAVEKVIDGFLRTQLLHILQGEAVTAHRWARLDDRADRAHPYIIRMSGRIRALLDLPPPGLGC